MLRRIKRSLRMADLCLFGRRRPARVASYLDRRQYDRSPVEMPITIQSAAFDGEHATLADPEASEFLAMTRDVSLRGVGFLHDDPFEGHYAVVTFDLLDGRPASLLLEVRWSNVPRLGSYMSGGRFLGIVDVPKS